MEKRDHFDRGYQVRPYKRTVHRGPLTLSKFASRQWKVRRIVRPIPKHLQVIEAQVDTVRDGCEFETAMRMERTLLLRDSCSIMNYSRQQTRSTVQAGDHRCKASRVLLSGIISHGLGSIVTSQQPIKALPVTSLEPHPPRRSKARQIREVTELSGARRRKVQSCGCRSIIGIAEHLRQMARPG